ncbi:hypothetical protein PILCRDRAFT_369279 [Piloderma croceum F 1598]|uniref:Uncharacterized protein n=1 Tax=Piloderma croceum (strain F 1598) TaxID=765440 RepID=A0A0C3C582_PILCF|nr:hypothetical protein PILCRDRAFT_369279 [Piloderma croceum F 1598]
MENNDIAEMSRQTSRLLSTWENNQRYGIVHRSECHICGLYKEHVADAALDNESSFQIARDELKRQHETLFSNGIAEGRRLQRLDDEVEWDAAREELALIRAQLEATLAEHRRYKQRVEVAEIRRDNWETIWKPSKGLFGMRTGEGWRKSEADGQPVAAPVRSPSPVGSSLSDTSFLTPADGTEVSQELPDSPVTRNDGTLPLQKSLAVQPSVQNVGDFRSISGTNRGCSGTDADQNVECPTAALWQTVGDAPIRTPRFIKQMDKLLKEANTPGNIEHYKKVKALCTEAHLAKDQKTDLQKYLLVKWKTPDWVKGPRPSFSDATNTVSGPPTNPLHDDPPEAWVVYYTAFPASCPLGVRRDIDGKPRLADMRASRIVARLRPDMMLDEHTTRAARMQFKEIAIRHLFSIPGRYHRILTNKNNAVTPQVTYQPFKCQPGDITLDRVALHFAKCGISIAIAESDLEPWAEECVSKWDEVGRV